MAEILRAAAAVIEEAGYDIATMSEIAERAGASIGSLYQFFPNKESVAEALRAEYRRELEMLWGPLKENAQDMDLRQLVDHLIGMMVKFYEDHPAFLRLLDVQGTTGGASARARFRENLTDLFAVRKPRLPRQEARRLAIITQQIMRGLRIAYADAKPQERPSLVEEFKEVLLCYFRSRLTAPTRKRS